MKKEKQKTKERGKEQKVNKENIGKLNNTLYYYKSHFIDALFPEVIQLSHKYQGNYQNKKINYNKCVKNSSSSTT